MAQGIAAFGAILSIDGSPDIPVAELTSMETPSLNTDYVELTHHQSPGGFREWAATLRDGEEVAIEGNYLPDNAGQAALRAANLSGALTPFILVLPGSMGTWTFDAFVRNIKATAPVDGKLGFTGSLKVTGLPSFA